MSERKTDQALEGTLMRLEGLFKAAATGIDTARELTERVIESLEQRRGVEPSAARDSVIEDGEAGAGAEAEPGTHVGGGAAIDVDEPGSADAGAPNGAEVQAEAGEAGGGSAEEHHERAQLAAIVESSDDAIIGMERDGSISTWNAGAEALFGYSAKEALAHGIELLDEETDEVDMAGMLERVLAGERTEPVELHTVTRDGHLIDISMNISPIREDGEIIGASMVARDVTVRRQAERAREIQLEVAAALAESAGEEEAMPKVLDALGEKLDWDVGSYWSADPQDGYRLHCRSFWSAPGLELEDVSESFRAASLAPDEGLPGKAYQAAEAAWVEQGFAAVDGTERAQSAASVGLIGGVVVPLRSDDVVIGALEFLTSEARERDDDVLAAMSVMAGQVAQFVARKQAERAAEQVKDDFFGLVSHELRTPLTSVIGYTEMLAKAERENLSEKGRKFVEVIRRNAQREMRLVGDLLMLVRIEAGTFELEPGQVSLRQIAADSVEAAMPAAEKNGVQVISKLGEVPPFKGDAVRLGQAVDNLISNAIKFNSDGGSVEVRLNQQGTDAVIEVADTGDGIPKEEQPRLFDRLYRSSSATQEHVPGTGLGLTIVKAIVEAHHGRIELESDVGRGSTFTITIPLEPPTEGEAASEGSSPATAGESANGRDPEPVVTAAAVAGAGPGAPSGAEGSNGNGAGPSASERDEVSP